MFKPSTRIRTRPFQSASAHQVPGFAETQFLHVEDDEDYSGFAPTEMFEETPKVPPRGVPGGTEAPRAAVPGEENAMPASWVTSRWVEAQEAKAHQAAHQARAVIAAQRRGDAPARKIALRATTPTGWLSRFKTVLQRVLPGDFYGVLPLFICVSITMALISAVLPLLDKP